MELFYSISVTYNKESILTMQSLCSFDLEGENTVPKRGGFIVQVSVSPNVFLSHGTCIAGKIQRHTIFYFK